MNLDEITAIVITKDEEANIERTLAALAWMREVLLIDSGSTDATLALADKFSNVRVVAHSFASFADQWNFAISLPRPECTWIMALDADHVAPHGLAEELRALTVPSHVTALTSKFTFWVDGVPIHSGVYRANPPIFRRGLGFYENDGHGHKLLLKSGETLPLMSSFHHDDRKPIGRYFASQIKYAQKEVDVLLSDRKDFTRVEQLRRSTCFAPFLVLAYYLFFRGGLLDGRRGVSYAFQRMTFEILVWLYLHERRNEMK